MDRRPALERGKTLQRKRTGVQLLFTAVSNAYLKGFATGSIYMGAGKQFCLPGLNCYSCPGALGSCPIGALQTVAGERHLFLPFYGLGFLLAVGVCLGRGVCGWLCPFGLVQDLLYRIPLWKRLRERIRQELETEEGSGAARRLDRGLRYLKYLMLGLLVLLLPMVAVDASGLGEPWFCKWVCPAGTLEAAWPLALLDRGIRSSLGFLFAWKSLLLTGILLLSLLLYRPFCRYLCPLGAAYGLLNRASFLRYRVEESACTHCGACRKACPMGIDVEHAPNSRECIRCGRCLSACPVAALKREPLGKGKAR